MAPTFHPASGTLIPLRDAILSGNVASVRLALATEEGKDLGRVVHHRRKKWSLLALAVDAGNRDVVEALLHAGALRATPKPSLDVGAFQAALSAGHLEVFSLLLTHCAEAGSPDFTPAGMTHSKKLKRVPTLWQAVLAHRPDWLPEVLARRHPTQPLTVAQALSVVQGSTALTLPVLDALTASAQRPDVLTEALAAASAQAAADAARPPQTAATAAALCADTVARWALDRGAALEGHPVLFHGNRARASALNHLAAFAPETGTALSAWVKARAHHCPLAALDAALQAAALHLRADTYTQLAEARAARPDAGQPMTPPQDGMWLSLVLTRLLCNLRPDPTGGLASTHQEALWQARAPAFLAAFCAHPLCAKSPYLDLCTALVALRGPSRPGAPPSPVVLNADQRTAFETLYAHWVTAGPAPTAEERAQLRGTIPEIMAEQEAWELGGHLPSPEPSGSSSRCRL